MVVVGPVMPFRSFTLGPTTTLTLHHSLPISVTLQRETEWWRRLVGVFMKDINITNWFLVSLSLSSFTFILHDGSGNRILVSLYLRSFQDPSWRIKDKGGDEIDENMNEFNGLWKCFHLSGNYWFLGVIVGEGFKCILISNRCKTEIYTKDHWMKP